MKEYLTADHGIILMNSSPKDDTPIKKEDISIIIRRPYGGSGRG